MIEKIGTHLIILQKRYNIKYIIDEILEKIKKFFFIISSIKTFVIPYIKKAIKNIKKDRFSRNY